MICGKEKPYKHVARTRKTNENQRQPMNTEDTKGPWPVLLRWGHTVQGGKSLPALRRFLTGFYKLLISFQ